MTSSNGESTSRPLELQGTLQIETTDGEQLSFEVVGILEDPDEGTSYAVLMREETDGSQDDEQFIVTDMDGNLLEDDALAQEILDEFMVFHEEAHEDGGEKS